MERLWSRLGMERCCVEAGRVLDDWFVRSVVRVNTSQNPLTCFGFSRTLSIGHRCTFFQFSLYLCHYYPPHEYVTLVSEAV